MHYVQCIKGTVVTVLRRLPPAERRGYTNVFNALYRITKEEGLLTLWRVRLYNFKLAVAIES